jgi:hypothetical protein
VNKVQWHPDVHIADKFHPHFSHHTEDPLIHRSSISKVKMANPFATGDRSNFISE